MEKNELNSLTFHVIAISGMMFFGASSKGSTESSGEVQTFRFSASSKPVVNPGKGWVIYGGTPKSHIQDALDVSSSAYTRFSWSELEPEEGKFNWEPVDKSLEAWSAAGKQFSFGIMCESFHARKQYCTPKWVFDQGVPSIVYDGMVKGKVALKQWDNPIFLQKLGNFMAAMGKRYDGDPRIAYIDIRSYGQWGEGHLGHLKGSEKLSLEGFRKHIQIHLDAFRKTRLLIPWGEPFFNPVYDWAIDKGVGIRRDGILGNSNGSELVRCKGKVPALGEWYDSYQKHRQNDGWKYAWGDKLEDRILDDTMRGAMTYQNLGQYDNSDLFVKEKRPFIDKLTNVMGYFFVLDEVSIPVRVAQGTDFKVSFRWENKGLASIFIPANVTLALIDEEGKIAATCHAIGCHPEKWAPGGKIDETTVLKFSAPVGNYRLAVGIFSEPNRKNPDIRLGIEGETIDNWHVLGKLSVY